jgi:hypothetical protein
MGRKAKTGHLPMWEVAKAVAFHQAINRIVKHTKQPAAELLGMRKDDCILIQIIRLGLAIGRLKPGGW